MNLHRFLIDICQCFYERSYDNWSDSAPILGRHVPAIGAVHPYSVLKPGEAAEAVNNLGLDSKQQKHWWDFVKYNRLLWHEAEPEWDMAEDDEEPIITFDTQLDRIMAELDSQCLALAERGIHNLSDLHSQTFETFVKHLQQCGLHTLSTAIQHLLTTSETRARHLFITKFLSHVYRQAAAWSNVTL